MKKRVVFQTTRAEVFMNIKGIEFDVEVGWEYGDEKKIEWVAIFLKGSEVELTDVLSDKVLDAIEERIYKDYPEGGVDYDRDDLREDR